MAGLPSHIFVVRHGNRLDAADKRWHLSSPTPYDPPLTYGGFLQARTTGNQIASYLEQAKLDAEASQGLTRKRKRYRVIIHSSPFLRCVQTSVGIASGIAQGAPDSPLEPADIVVPARNPVGRPGSNSKTATLRIDAFLGEWLSTEYFEKITPPPESSRMVNEAKGQLLRQEDYSMYSMAAPPAQALPTNLLWSASPTTNSGRSFSPAIESGSKLAAPSSSLARSPGSDDRKRYKPLHLNHAPSNSGKIPDGLVAHARDECVALDMQWESTQPPMGFGDGGKLGEEWPAMHERFRRGLKKMLNWYATANSPEKIVSASTDTEAELDRGQDAAEEDIETVVVMVSHGAGCNALLGAITHQSVLMDVSIASLTMAVRKPSVDYEQLLAQIPRIPQEEPLVRPDEMYDVRLFASTEHLRSMSSTPVSSRSTSVAQTWSSGARGRSSTTGSSLAPSLSAFTYNESLPDLGSRSSSASRTPTNGTTTNGMIAASQKRESTPRRPPLAPLVPVTNTPIASNGISSSATAPFTDSPTPNGLWTPSKPTLSLLEERPQEDEYKFLDFDQYLSFNSPATPQDDGESDGGLPNVTIAPSEDGIAADLNTPELTTRPMLSGPMKLRTDWTSNISPEDVNLTHLHDDFDSVQLGSPPAPDDADRFRDLSQSKRRWTITDQTR